MYIRQNSRAREQNTQRGKKKGKKSVVGSQKKRTCHKNVLQNFVNVFKRVTTCNATCIQTLAPLYIFHAI